MRTLSLILNVVLLVAVGVLFYLHFEKNTPEEVESDVIENESPALSIAYVNADTVLTNYEFFKEKQAELEKKQKELDQEYRNRAEGFQAEVTNYQQSMGNLTIAQAKAREEDLSKKQQNLRVYQERLTQELMQAEAKVNEELYKKVTSYIKEYSENNDIEIVVKYNQGSDVLYAGEAMDITQNIIEGLNNKHLQESTVKETP